MKRRLAIAATLVRSALRGLQSSALTSGIAVFTIAVALVLAGGFALVASNMAGVLQRFGEELQVVAYLEDGLEPDALRSLSARVETVEGVQGVKLVSKQQALARFRERLGGGSLLDGLEENPLPASLTISLLPPAAVRADGLRPPVIAVTSMSSNNRAPAARAAAARPSA